jgi:hypothetical protein
MQTPAVGRMQPATRGTDEQTVIFGARVVAKTLYPAGIYCIAFRK